MPRTPVLAVAAVLLVGAAGAAHADGTDVVLVTATAADLTLTGGSATVPLTGVNAAIGSATTLGGSLMTVSDLRGSTLGWKVTAQYSAPDTSLLTLPNGLNAASISALPASAIKVDTNETVTGVGVNASYTSGYVALPSSGAVNVASAAAGSTGGVSTFTPSYQVTLPASASAASVYAAQVTYTVISGPATLATP